MEGYLFDLGLSYYVFDPGTVNFTALQNFKLIIWNDLGKGTNGLSNKAVDVFQQVYNAQIPLYFIGERLASSTANLTEPYRSEWTQLIHLQPATTQGGSGTISIATDIRHQVINGRFGYVLDFAYPAEVDVTTVVGADAYRLASSGSSDVLVANQDSGTGERTVSQDFLVIDGTGDADSISERQRVFQNAVWWLLRKPVCNLTDLVITESASSNPAQTGQQLDYTLTVQRSGECDGTGVVVTDVLPPGVQFVSADTPQGTWAEADGVVTFHLGALQDVFLQLTVSVIPSQPGSITNIVRIRGNESDQNLNNNSASLAVQVQGAAVTVQSADSGASPEAKLSLLRTADGLVLIQVRSAAAADWILESSIDLVRWTPRTQFTTGTAVTQFTDRPEGRQTFYRLRAVELQTR
jgi:uncharacterized repeat protein (TIGR01451 family)